MLNTEDKAMSVDGVAFCYGCGVCQTVCSQKCIEMKLSKEGFITPYVDLDRCTKCGACRRICSKFNPLDPSDLTPKTFKAVASWIKDRALLKRCSSGGVVMALAKHLSEKGFKLCGVRYDKDKVRAEHFIADTIEEFLPATGSKYIQSLTQPAFNTLVHSQDKWVVVGTPCQMAALRRVIKKYKLKNQFLLIDFWCHGVPSYRLWRSYLKSALGHVDFHGIDARWRGKSLGWQESWQLTLSRDADVLHVGYATRGNDKFWRHFLRNTVQNLSCNACPYAGLSSAADIRVGDYWGEEFANNSNGVSKVVCLTPTGTRVWQEVAYLVESVPMSEKGIDAIKSAPITLNKKSAWGRDVFIALLNWPHGLRLAHYWSLLGCVIARITRRSR